MRGSTAEHSALVNNLLLRLNEFGLFKKNHVGLFRHLYSEQVIDIGIIGSPDIEGLLKFSGKYCGIEVKTGQAVQRKSQKSFQKIIETLGGVYIVARDIEGTLASLRELVRKGL